MDRVGECQYFVPVGKQALGDVLAGVIEGACNGDAHCIQASRGALRLRGKERSARCFLKCQIAATTHPIHNIVTNPSRALISASHHLSTLSTPSDFISTHSGWTR